MASSSSLLSSPSTISALLSHPVAEKLTRENFALWQAQVLPAVRSAQLLGVLEGKVTAPSVTTTAEDPVDKTKTVTVSNPEYVAWLVQDQLLLGYLNNSMSRELLAQVARCTTSAQVWTKLQSMFASQSRSQIVHLRNKLTTTRKGELPCAAYFTKMTGFADGLAAAGKPIEDEDVISYILAGLDEEFNPFIENVCGRVDPISLGEFYAQLLTTEARIDAQRQAQQYMAANAAARGRGRGGRGGPFVAGRGGGRHDGAGRGNRGGRSPNTNNSNGNNRDNKPLCQLCKTRGHTVLRCWKRFDTSYTGKEEKTAGVVSSYGTDPIWYADSGATDHITSELDKLTTKERYNGGDQVHTANGQGPSHEETSSAWQV